MYAIVLRRLVQGSRVRYWANVSNSVCRGDNEVSAPPIVRINVLHGGSIQTPGEKVQTNYSHSLLRHHKFFSLGSSGHEEGLLEEPRSMEGCVLC